MDVGATSLNKGTEQAVTSSGNSNSTSEANALQVATNSLQESVATSRLSSLLSSLVEPFAATPRMPQPRGPRNVNDEEKASLPQPVSTPTFPIPPHVMGRNIDNPVDDLVAHGRRLQKPRLGVRVPYRNLTSQIVTQDELAQELLERSLKKHPVHDIPEGGDLFFAIKLTQRLANRLSPSTAQGSATTVTQADATPGKSTQPQQASASNCAHPPNHPAATNSTEHSDLIAILEGDVDPDWAPTPKQPDTVVNAGHVSSQFPHITNVKLDPLLEKELALKQLMEFQTNSRRRKSDKNQKSSESQRKGKSQVKKEPVNKENGVNDQTDTQNNNMLNIETKQAKKRKLSESTQSTSKKPRLTGKKSSPQNKIIVKANVNIDKKKTDVKVPKKTKVSKNGIQSNDVNNADVIYLGPIAPEASAKTDFKPKSSKTSNDSRKTATITSKKKLSNSSKAVSPNASSPKQDRTLNNSNSGKAENSVSTEHCTSIIDGLPEFPRSFPTPLRTYSPKKRVSNQSVLPKVQMTESAKNRPESAVPESAPPKMTMEENSNSVSASSPKQVNSSQPSKKKDAKDVKEADKKRRMGEVDRLLMDEGAINLLYEAEHGESRRRSSLPEENENNSTNQRRILKSVRRKKKDLILKTRLVKSAVLRLSSNSSAATLPIASRAKRRLDTSSLQATDDSQVSSPQRKLSLDSHDSLRSPPPLTPNDPPSPQSFIYPARLPLPAEASRIIRRHSSSSNFSSRSASPNNIRTGDMSQSAENAGNAHGPPQKDIQEAAVTRNSAKLISQGSEGRKKGVPIFIRKPQVTQTYKGKKKKDDSSEIKNSDRQVPAKNGNKVTENSSKVATKVQSEAAQKLAMQKKISMSDKLKLKAEMSKNFQKGFQSAKLKLKKTLESNAADLKKKQDGSKEKTQKSDVGSNTSTEVEIVDETPDLTSCLAAAASAFAAEAREMQEGKSMKKVSGSSGTSHSSSPCPSRSSKSPTPTNRSVKKGPAAPLSPNATTYSNLLKTLENESQKPRKKDGEEATKQRSSVRQNAGTFHYKEINLRRYDNLVQIILTPQSTKMKNAMNLQVLRELREALHQLKRDDSCRAVLLTSTGSSFCQGIDFYSLLHTNAERRKSAAQELAQALKEFLKCLALFSKPIVAGVHGAAVGLGVTMLPFFDMVFASDKATFYTPYAKLGQVPEGAAILTLPHMFGNAVTSELLFGCRKLTASEALHFGLVTRILWPDRFQEELIPVIRSMANQSSQSMEATKALLRHNLRTKLDAALESETHLLVQHWISAECQANFKRFLDDEDVGLQKQRMEA